MRSEPKAVFLMSIGVLGGSQQERVVLGFVVPVYVRHIEKVRFLQCGILRGQKSVSTLPFTMALDTLLSYILIPLRERSPFPSIGQRCTARIAAQRLRSR